MALSYFSFFASFYYFSKGWIESVGGKPSMSSFDTFILIISLLVVE